MTARELYQAGKLSEAIQAALDEVRTHPTDVPRRYFLSELLCFAGDLARADKQLEVICQQSTEAAMRVNLFRHVVHAELARQEFYSVGRVPEFLAEPTPSLQCRLRASIEFRENRLDEATKLLEEAEQLRPRPTGMCNGARFDDFRDLDDLTAGVFEVLTSTGKYYWVPVEQVELLEFQPPQRPSDLLWREAHMVVTDGPDGVVYLPTTYAGGAEADAQLRLGRGTDWIGGDGSAVRGRGLRMYLVGDDDRTCMELKDVQFDRAAE
jgi:type VI secretion system protein ImpE